MFLFAGPKEVAGEDEDQEEGSVSQSRRNTTVHNKTDKKVIDWAWAKKKVRLTEILSDGGETREAHKRYVYSTCKDRVTEQVEIGRDYFDIPRDWFINKDDMVVNFEGSIAMACDRSQSRFAFINYKKSLYICYDKWVNSK